MVDVVGAGVVLLLLLLLLEVLATAVVVLDDDDGKAVVLELLDVVGGAGAVVRVAVPPMWLALDRGTNSAGWQLPAAALPSHLRAAGQGNKKCWQP